MNKNLHASIKVLSGFCVNIAAGWFGVAFITPNFTHIPSLGIILTLTEYVLFGILFLVAAFFLEKKILYDKQ